MAQDITVPDLGDFKNVEVIDVLVKPGDKIDVDTPLITLETEKAAMDVPSTAAGVVKSVVIKKGDRVSKGNVIVQVEGAAAGDKKEEKKPAAAQATPAAGGEKADDALCRFAHRYADQTERDHATLLAAIERGVLPATSGL